jgi:hypothetical protein
MRIWKATDYRPLAPRTAVIASLSLAGLLGIIAVATRHTDVAPAKSHAVSAPSVSSAGVPGSPRSRMRTGTAPWQANARTIVAMIRYLLEPEMPAEPSGGFPPLPRAMPTNIVSTPAPMRATS